MMTGIDIKRREFRRYEKELQREQNSCWEVHRESTGR